MVQVKIKWNKVTFDDVEINISEGVTGLKNKILELTGVPLDRQKLMAKGGWIGTLKDDADLSKLKITPGLQILLMGSADVVVAPKEAITFFEDLTSEQKAEKGVAVSAGLNNLGNTCYMNSTVQCFRHMSELRETLAPLRASQDVNVDFSVALRDTLTQMDGTSGSFTPFAFVGKLRNNFPQFAQADPRGNFMQQDAEEFFNLLVNCLDRGVSSVQPGRFDQLLTVQLEEELTCKETEAEPKVIKTDRVNKIVCNIDATVDHLQDGIKIAFEGTMEKHSSVLGRDAVWGKKQRIASLPLYLCVHFMRFFWKATPESRDHAGVKCKVLRPVSYPEVLDVFGLCSDGLQQSLRRNREVERKKFEDEFKLKQGATAGAAAAAAGASASADAAVSAAVPEAVAMDVEADEEAALAAALSLSLASDGAASASASAVSASEVGELVSQGLPVGFTGNYELFGLVTHKGRSADSGHYIGWVRQAPGSQFWWKYDDEKVSEVATDEIMKLSGGGDRDMAYFVFYRAK